ncbi:putative Ccaat-binding transcription factor subunit A [Tripterygium wilfordii]|uniref:Putative Ccaat-binding transcription factor subunit A n=1 Tax=Tripterygium wilfordii TaxID=458696 RepID=A0A7J7C1V6_TRIWF|nr:putative Ccaat-binding transcription factor subunit A [Tripterygium wilfordii]
MEGEGEGEGGGGGGLHRHGKHARTTYEAYAGSGSSSNITINNNRNTNSVTNYGEQHRQQATREQDQYMPIANVIRIMRRILPPHAKISDDAKETIQECVSEFISFVTSEANERCHQEQRKTITADDVLWAMGKLGFDNYTQPLSLFLQRYREAERESNSVRGESLPKRGLDYGAAAAVSLPPILPAFNVSGNIQTMMYDPAQVVMGGYYRDESGGSSSQQNVNNIHGFDNFPQGVPGNKIDDQYGFK